MLTATKTTTINRAFLREIKEDNHELSRLFATVRTLLSDPLWWEHSGERFLQLLGELRDQVAMHFALEEFYGYFDNPCAVAPRLAERTEALRCQHGDLYLGICQLAEEAEVVRYGRYSQRALRELGLSFRDFDAAFQYHEARETELISEALLVDIGGRG